MNDCTKYQDTSTGINKYYQICTDLFISFNANEPPAMSTMLLTTIKGHGGCQFVSMLMVLLLQKDLKLTLEEGCDLDNFVSATGEVCSTVIVCLQFKI